MKLCDSCKRALEQFHAWTESSDHKPILFHGKNMNNGFFSCVDSEDRIKYQCIRTLIEGLAQDDENTIGSECTIKRVYKTKEEIIKEAQKLEKEFLEKHPEMRDDNESK